MGHPGSRRRMSIEKQSARAGRTTKVAMESRAGYHRQMERSLLSKVGEYRVYDLPARW